MLRIRFFYSFVLLCFSFLLLAGCLSDDTEAPIRNVMSTPIKTGEIYRVKTGDTIYSIAWVAGLDYRAFAAANQLTAPYLIYPGQVLRITTILPRQHRSTATVRSANPVPVKYAPASPVILNQTIHRWIRPTRGQIVEYFSESSVGNKGIDIAGQLGQPVRATAAGVVVYCGNGVRGYGNLIIIKHNAHYLSAYAYNRRLIVHLGQSVRSGQTIAVMGQNDAGKVRLHFEIRREGRAINPLECLR